MAGQRPDRLTLLAFVGVVLLGGGNSVAIRLGNPELSPFWGATLRFAAASLVFFVFMLVLRLPFPRGRAFIGAVIYGMLAFGGAFAFVYWGLVSVPAGPSQVILAMAPLLTFLLAIAIGQERFRWQTLAGALITLVGIGILFGDQLGTDIPLLSLLSIMAGAGCFAASAVVIKAFPASHPVTSNAIGMGAGALLLFAATLFSGSPLTLPTIPVTWISLVYLVLLGSVGVFSLTLFVLQRWTASATSFSFVLMPFVTIAAAALLLGERISPLFGLGGALVLAGVYLGALTASGTTKRAATPSKATPR